MTDHLFGPFSINGSDGNRIVRGKGRLKVDIPAAMFQTAFSNFTAAAETFARGLSETLDRKFAYRYLTYLQEVAAGTEPAKPSAVAGRPTCRLICNELERLFAANFCQSKAVLARTA